MDELMSDDEEENKKVELLKKHQDILLGDTFGELAFIVITQTNIDNIASLIQLVSPKDEAIEIIKNFSH